MNDLSVETLPDLAASPGADLATPPDSASPGDGSSSDGATAAKPLMVYIGVRALDGSDSVSAGAPGNVWLLRSDGSSLPLTRLTKANTDSLNPSWSPDGQKILFESARALDGSDNTNSIYNVWVMNADGSGPTPLTQMTMANTNCDLPVWSPDGTKIAFQSFRNLNGTDNGGATPNIWIMSANGSSQTPLTMLTDVRAHAQYPVWAPDGSKIAYAATRNLDGSDSSGAPNVWSIQPNGAGDQPITRYTSLAGPQVSAWSSDSTRLAFDSAGALNGSDATGSALNVWATALAPTPSPSPLTMSSTAGVDSQFPRWSPVAGKIAYQSTADPSGGGGASGDNIWVMNGDGSGKTALTQLTVPSIGVQFWSPDGTRIAFASNRKLDGSDAKGPNNTNNIWVMNADGSMPTPLTQLTASGTAAGELAWHP